MELKVMETMDYSLFSKFNGNRDVNKLHVNRIAKSMSEQFLIKPIDVNEKHEVIDGQHRLEACKETGNPLYYIVQKGWGLQEAHRLNANQKIIFGSSATTTGETGYIQSTNRYDLIKLICLEEDLTFTTLNGISNLDIV